MILGSYLQLLLSFDLFSQRIIQIDRLSTTRILLIVGRLSILIGTLMFVMYVVAPLA